MATTMALRPRTEPSVGVLILQLLQTKDEHWWSQREIAEALQKRTGSVCRAIMVLVKDCQLESVAPTKGTRGMRYRVMKAGRVAPLFTPLAGVDSWPLAQALGGFTYIGERPWQTI